MEGCKYNCTDDNMLFSMDRGWYPCPIHGGIKKKVEELDTNKPMNYYNLLNIPKSHRQLTGGITGDDFFKAYRKSDYVDGAFVEMIAKMNEMLDSVKHNQVYPESVLLVVNPEIDIEKFIYAYQLECMFHDITTVPYCTVTSLYRKQLRLPIVSAGKEVIDKSEIYEYMMRLRRTYDSENPYTIEDYIAADVVFLHLGYYATSEIADAVGSILLERSRREKPTYFIGSSTNMDEWNKWNDSGRTFLKLFINVGYGNQYASIKPVKMGLRVAKEDKLTVAKKSVKSKQQAFMSGVESLGKGNK